MTTNPIPMNAASLECLSERELMALVNAIGKTMHGHPGGTCALALCHCLAVVINQTGMPQELVIDTIKKYVDMGDPDETAH